MFLFLSTERGIIEREEMGVGIELFVFGYIGRLVREV